MRLGGKHPRRLHRASPAGREARDGIRARLSNGQPFSRFQRLL